MKQGRTAHLAPLEFSGATVYRLFEDFVESNYPDAHGEWLDGPCEYLDLGEWLDRNFYAPDPYITFRKLREKAEREGRDLQLVIKEYNEEHQE